MNTLISDMVQEDSQRRPAIDQVIVRFDEIRHTLSSWKLRARLIARHEDVITRLFK